jgi:epoxyqueuosine reductase
MRFLDAMNTVDATEVTQEILRRGADLCGIASVSRFSHAPHGFHPHDIYPACQSIVVFAKAVPYASLTASSCVPYTHVSELVTQEVDRIGLALAYHFQDLTIGAVPIPSSEPYESWDDDRQHGQAILSLRHAGELAGLGRRGKNTLLINNTYGNMIQLGALLLDIPLESTPLVTTPVCPRDCRLCLDACPVHALDGTTVDQRLCRPLSNFKTKKGYTLKKCHRCRSICPHCLPTR